MDFAFGFPANAQERTGILVIVGRFSKMVQLLPVAMSIIAKETADLFIELIFKHHAMQATIVSDRDLPFTVAFWSRLFELLVTRLVRYTAAHPETDGKMNRSIVC